MLNIISKPFVDPVDRFATSYRMSLGHIEGMALEGFTRGQMARGLVKKGHRESFYEYTTRMAATFFAYLKVRQMYPGTCP